MKPIDDVFGVRSTSGSSFAEELTTVT